MKLNWCLSLLALSGTLCLAQAPCTSIPEIGSSCTGKFKGHRKPTSNELKAIIKDHTEWLQSDADYADSRRANLCEADLEGAQLEEVDLSLANLSGAELCNAHLRRARLNGAYLRDADLTGADMKETDLSVGYHRKTLPSGVINTAPGKIPEFYGGVEIKYTFTDLRKTNIIGTDLAGANLSFAELDSAVFEPKLEGLPAITGVIYARGLSTMTYREMPSAMIAVAQELRKLGLRDQERQLTFAVNHTRRIKSGAIDSLFGLILFESICQWGMAPWRPLVIILVMVLAFCPLYAAAIASDDFGGIWAVPLKDRVSQEDLNEKPFRLTTTYPFFGLWVKKKQRWLILRWVEVLLSGLYFSLLSAFELGWRELTISSWISRMQPREYLLRGTGWVRFLSGLQSVVSVYLLALWALSYFSRPFG